MIKKKNVKKSVYIYGFINITVAQMLRTVVYEILQSAHVTDALRNTNLPTSTLVVMMKQRCTKQRSAAEPCAPSHHHV